MPPFLYFGTPHTVTAVSLRLEHILNEYKRYENVIHESCSLLGMSASFKGVVPYLKARVLIFQN